MLTIPPARRRWEAARAAEIQEADRALAWSRFRWFLLGMGMVFLGYPPLAWSFHVQNEKIGDVLFWTSILVADGGPLVVLWLAAKSEE